jgi:hypothetical protein
MDDIYYVSHKVLEPTIEGEVRERNGPIFGVDIYVNTFEFVLEENETIRSIVLKTKWRYRCGSLFGDGKKIGDWDPEFNDVISVLTAPARQHEHYLKMTGRLNEPASIEGQATFYLPLTIAYDAGQTMTTISTYCKNIKLEYVFSQPSLETRLYVEIVTKKTEPRHENPGDALVIVPM